MSPRDLRTDLIWLESQRIDQVSRQARPDQFRHIEPNLYPTIGGHGTVNFDLSRVRKLYNWYSITHVGKLVCGGCGGQRRDPGGGQFPVRWRSSSNQFVIRMSSEAAPSSASPIRSMTNR